MQGYEAEVRSLTEELEKFKNTLAAGDTTRVLKSVSKSGARGADEKNVTQVGLIAKGLKIDEEKSKALLKDLRESRSNVDIKKAFEDAGVKGLNLEQQKILSEIRTTAGATSVESVEQKISVEFTSETKDEVKISADGALYSVKRNLMEAIKEAEKDGKDLKEIIKKLDTIELSKIYRAEKGEEGSAKGVNTREEFLKELGID